MLTTFRQWLNATFTQGLTELAILPTPASHSVGYPARPLPNTEATPEPALYEAVPYSNAWALKRGRLIVWPELSRTEAEGLAKTLNGELRLKARVAEVRKTP